MNAVSVLTDVPMKHIEYAWRILVNYDRDAYSLPVPCWDTSTQLIILNFHRYIFAKNWTQAPTIDKCGQRIHGTYSVLYGAQRYLTYHLFLAKRNLPMWILLLLLVRTTRVSLKKYPSTPLPLVDRKLYSMLHMSQHSHVHTKTTWVHNTDSWFCHGDQKILRIPTYSLCSCGATYLFVISWCQHSNHQNQKTHWDLVWWSYY